MRRPVTPPAAGVSAELARDRAARISSLRYTVTLQVPPSRTDPLRGRLRATFTLADASKPLSFDFAQPTSSLLTAVSNGRSVEPLVENGHIVIPRSHLASGENVVELEFLAGDVALNRHDDFLYSLFVPARASTTLPCFDQPDVKARWTLSMQVPRGWTAVSNGRESARSAETDNLHIDFDETAPLPTYLFAFAA